MMTSTEATHNIHENTGRRRIVPRPDGPATVLAIGTAVPPNVFLQKDYPDFYFGITGSNHQSELKHKFKRICKLQGRLLYIMITPSASRGGHIYIFIYFYSAASFTKTNDDAYYIHMYNSLH